MQDPAGERFRCFDLPKSVDAAPLVGRRAQGVQRFGRKYHRQPGLQGRNRPRYRLRFSNFAKFKNLMHSATLPSYRLSP